MRSEEEARQEVEARALLKMKAVTDYLRAYSKLIQTERDARRRGATDRDLQEARDFLDRGRSDL